MELLTRPLLYGGVGSLIGLGGGLLSKNIANVNRLKKIKNGQVIYNSPDLTAPISKEMPVNGIIPQNAENFKGTDIKPSQSGGYDYAVFDNNIQNSDNNSLINNKNMLEYTQEDLNGQQHRTNTNLQSREGNRAEASNNGLYRTRLTENNEGIRPYIRRSEGSSSNAGSIIHDPSPEFRAELEAQGKPVQHKELGTITANQLSRKKYASKAGSDLKYKIAPKLDELVKNAEYVGTEFPLTEKRTDFIRVHKLVNRTKIGENNVDFIISVGEDAKGNLFYNIDDITERATSAKNSLASIAPNDIITNFSKISTPRMREVKNLLKNKVNKNAEYYLKEGLLSEETVNDLPVNTYAAIKNQKPLIELTDAEKLDALNDINKMPAEQRPFYVPKMYEDKLKLSDFFNKDIIGDNRIYDPVEIANRLDLNRISLINAENMINEIIENFAKPLNLSKEKVLDNLLNPKTSIKNPTKIKATIGDVSDNVFKVAKEQNIDLTGYKHNIDYSAKNHIKNNHSNGKEYLRGQIDITKEDLKKIPDVIYNADEVIYSGKNNHGLDTFKYKKTMDDGTVYYIEEIRTGRKTLTTDSIYKHKKAGEQM